MEPGQRKPFSEAVTAFYGRPLPEATIPVGYAALIDAFELAVPAHPPARHSPILRQAGSLTACPFVR